MVVELSSPRCLQQWLAEFAISAPVVPVSALCLDSREVAAGGCFVAIKGHQTDGRQYLDSAVERGARVLLVETAAADEHGHVFLRGEVVQILFFALSTHLSALASAFYGHPSHQLSSIAVTGTNGKTSVVNMIAQLRSRLQQRCGIMGTLGNGIYGSERGLEPSDNTTPHALHMQALLYQWQQQGVRYCAYEASSHALVQRRAAAVQTAVAIFTNLTRDHLDYHGTMEAYAAAKRQLLQQPGLSAVVLNADDAESQRWAAQAGNLRLIWTSCDATSPMTTWSHYCIAQDLRFTPKGCEFRLLSSWGERDVRLPLLGQFNLSNALQACAALLWLDEDFSHTLAALEQLCPVPGRMELFLPPTEAQAAVVVDYAHTPDALLQALKSARKHTSNKLWCVFGCGGDRDKGKRPLMGQIAEQWADEVIITTDNARSESPAAIVADILAGLQQPQQVQDIPQREAALRYCLTHACAGDVILMAGKGHETYQILQHQTLCYDERATVRRLLEEFRQ